VLLAGESCDLVLVSRAASGGDPGVLLGRFQRHSDRPEVIVVREGDDARDRARLLAAGTLAVLDSRLADPELAAALATLAGRRRRSAIQHLRSDRTAGGAEAVQPDASPAMREVLATAHKIAASGSSVLLLGETGSGKEWLAREIHRASGRGAERFQAVNCSALPETLIESELFGHVRGAFTGADRPRRGAFELAHRGTLLLDEIGDMPPAAQTRLLRVLLERRIRRLGSEEELAVDVRILAATSRDLSAARAAGQFRDDLYFRLAVVTLELPPLRARIEDLPGLARLHLAKIGHRLGRPGLVLTDTAIAALGGYRWPGNVRELINVLERTVLLTGGDRIGAAELRIDAPAQTHGDRSGAETRRPAAGWTDRPLQAVRDEALAEVERRYLEAQLRATGGSIAETARRAGIGPRALHKKMRRYALRREDFARLTDGSSGGRSASPSKRC
jgi:DNA-binding NtrC family response regulator